jgi:hypothetical protein
MFTITSHDGHTGGVAAPPAALAVLRRILTPERILLAMTDARMFTTTNLPQGVTPKRAGYTDVIWSEPTDAAAQQARAAAHNASQPDVPYETDTLSLKSIHWHHVWQVRTADGVSLEYRLYVRLAPVYREGHRPNAGHMMLGGELSQCPELPAGLTETALSPKYRASSLNFTAKPKA